MVLTPLKAAVSLLPGIEAPPVPPLVADQFAVFFQLLETAPIQNRLVAFAGREKIPSKNRREINFSFFRILIKIRSESVSRSRGWGTY